MPDRGAAGRVGLLRALAAAYALFAALAPHSRLPSPCPFRRMTGVRCPLCGLTRATRALTRGDVSGSLALHPLALLLWLAAAIALTRREDLLTHPLEPVSKRSARLDAPLDTALDRHVPACPCYQHELHRPATPSLVQRHPSRTAYFETGSKFPTWPRGARCPQR